VTVVASLTSVRAVHGRPHNAHPAAKINKVKDLALLFWLVSLSRHDFIFCQKTSWPSVFLRIFTHIHLMTCLSSMVNLIAVATRSGLDRLSSAAYCCSWS